MSAAPGAPLLIVLPDGLNVGGVAAWAVRLASGLAARGRGAALLLHPEPPGQVRLEFPVDARVRVLRPTGLGRFGVDPTVIARAVVEYRNAVRSLAADFGGPVVVSPNLHGDCYGAAAALTMVDPELVRIVGWQHGDNGYDDRVLAHYEPMVTRFVAVSDRIESVLKARLPDRAMDVVNLPCGVEVPQDSANPKSETRNPKSGVLRLIYLGRVEHRPKRVLALVRMSRELAARGIDHRLTVAGDGPAAGEFAEAAAGMSTIRIVGPVPPARVPTLLREHDLFVLPSGSEGLSLAMLEAMASGCVPVVARTESGAMQVVERGWNGEIADVPPEAGEDETGVALALSIVAALKRGIAAMSDAAVRTVRERFSLGRHVERASALLDEIAASPARAWPLSRPCAFTSSDGAGGSGSVPAGGAERMRAALAKLVGRSVVIHGVGEHTRQLGVVFAESPARIVAFTDDDRARHGGTMWNWPVIAPGAASAAGATDVVISSWMHEAAIWSRRSNYEQQGLRVRRVYASPDSDRADRRA
jgi:glycosyltransferase involved in cell wall biosynthesis